MNMWFAAMNWMAVNYCMFTYNNAGDFLRPQEHPFNTTGLLNKNI